jgi:hypothetical protein
MEATKTGLLECDLIPFDWFRRTAMSKLCIHITLIHRYMNMSHIYMREDIPWFYGWKIMKFVHCLPT